MDDLWRDLTFLGGVLILIFTMVRIARRRRKRKASREPARDWTERETPRARAHSRSNRTATDGLNQLLVQLQETGREIEARLDTRVRYAKRLMEESEAVLMALEAAVGRARDLVETLPRERAAGERQPEGLFDTGEREPPRPDPAESTGNVTRDPQETAIAELAAKGEPPEAIARAVERPVGEVELILSLLQTKNRNAP